MEGHLDNEVQFFWVNWGGGYHSVFTLIRVRKHHQRPIKIYWGEETQLAQKCFCYYEAKALALAYLGKQKKKSTLVAVNTVHLLYYPN